MKFLRVNLTTKNIDTQEVPEEYAGLGGRGLTSNLINSEVPAACDPLGPENKLVFAPGYLSGTPLINKEPAHRRYQGEQCRRYGSGCACQSRDNGPDC